MENIKANELRIGNFYDHNGFVNEVTPNTIEEVWITERSWVKPIPLTEEWLLKFGFYSEEKIWRYKLSKYDWIDISEFNEEGWFVLDDENGHFNRFGIKYVHQLQNLHFALTEEELTFKS